MSCQCVMNGLRLQMSEDEEVDRQDKIQIDIEM
mgnify:CR=1 FL=1